MWRHLDLFVNIKYGEITGINEKTQKPHSFLSPLLKNVFRIIMGLLENLRVVLKWALRVHEWGNIIFET